MVSFFLPQWLWGANVLEMRQGSGTGEGQLSCLVTPHHISRAGICRGAKENSRGKTKKKEKRDVVSRDGGREEGAACGIWLPKAYGGFL